jgi:hypothetical protein
MTNGSWACEDGSCSLSQYLQEDRSYFRTQLRWEVLARSGGSPVCKQFPPGFENCLGTSKGMPLQQAAVISCMKLSSCFPALHSLFGGTVLQWEIPFQRQLIPLFLSWITSSNFNQKISFGSVFVRADHSCSDNFALGRLHKVNKLL